MKIFNYKNYKKINYRLYYYLNYVPIILLVLGIFLSTVFKNEKITIIVIFVVLLALLITRCLEFNMITKCLSFNAYVIKDDVLYKIGTYPKTDLFSQIGYVPNDEDFRLDNHFLYKIFRKWNIMLFTRIRYTLRPILAMININDNTFVENLFNQENDYSIIYKINCIYSYTFSPKENCYYIICDAIDVYNNTSYDKVKIKIQKEFDKNDEIEKFLKTKSLDKNVSVEELYENSNIAKQRKESVLTTKRVAILIMLIFVLFELILVFVVKNMK